MSATCPYCHHPNPLGARTCVCGATLAVPAVAGPSPVGRKPWTCPHCSHSNSSSEAWCICGADGPQLCPRSDAGQEGSFLAGLLSVAFLGPLGFLVVMLGTRSPRTRGGALLGLWLMPLILLLIVLASGVLW